jgi:hypothetical protein
LTGRTGQSRGHSANDADKEISILHAYGVLGRSSAIFGLFCHLTKA